MPGKHSSWSLEIVSLANLFICKRTKSENKQPTWTFTE